MFGDLPKDVKTTNDLLAAINNKMDQVQNYAKQLNDIFKAIENLDANNVDGLKAIKEAIEKLKLECNCNCMGPRTEGDDGDKYDDIFG